MEAHETGGNLFELPASDWSDHQIAVGLAELATELRWCEQIAELGDRYERLHALAVVLAGERDSRRALARAVDDVYLLPPPAGEVSW